ncbi:arginine N-succinyltransferase [Celerinatantimonas diazotrophica]|uniref:Arginine N-succinyltransferase n=1 Tax=Celerinatantimonas diazotrophica TaxID=412034 RepID=A0A4R1K153_9GAMM|nr:arginine N-succinyltransferase [Celerinatantimonas diazotrophica]TCK57708.1 arginine N-succinyltransferase [Celerinatantimonas diazotrophica]CAG9298230.1 Arginine N-succinyltransferase [Celerinatantimonas diazotrophica]
MLVVRPIKQSDFAALFAMADESGVGFTSLPVDEPLLRDKIAHSLRSFAGESEPERFFLMVAEDSETGEVVGTSAIDAAVGLTTPFYTYHLGKVVHASRSLNVYNVVETLTLSNDYTGVTELCTLFLREAYRSGNNGRLLSKCRFLMLAEHPEVFHPTVIAEMRGVSDEQGNSPFWQWLEQHFFSVDFPTADYLTGVGRKEFIAELMPKHPIYVNLLSEQAQSVIGQVHSKTIPALKLLQGEGFQNRGYVDIFDAGPTIECRLDNIRSVAQSQKVHVVIGDVIGGDEMLLANTNISQFRACVDKVNLNTKRAEVTITAATGKALRVNEGDPLRLVAVR